jgi:hypothetical protein
MEQLENKQIIVSEKSQKERFIENVQRWVLIDKQMKIINEKTKKLRSMKHDINDEICNYMNENNLSNNKIGISDGELKIYEKKEYSPLTFGFIEKSLAEILPNKKNVEFIINYLKSHREIKSSQELRRNIKQNESIEMNDM